MNATAGLFKITAAAFASCDRKAFLAVAFKTQQYAPLTWRSSGWPYHRLVKSTVAVGHRLTWRWAQLFHLAKTSFHSEYFAGWAVANARCFGGVVARKSSESCIKIVSGRSQLISLCGANFPARSFWQAAKRKSRQACSN